MDAQKLTEKSQNALAEAQKIAANRGHQGVDAEHLLQALLEDRDGLAGALLARTGNDIKPLRVALDKALAEIPEVRGPGQDASRAYLTQRLVRLLSQAEDEAEALRDEYVSVEHLLLCLLGGEGAAGEVLRAAGLDRPALLSALQEIRGNQRVTSPVSYTHLTLPTKA